MFDPYRQWLKIPSEQRPPTHYELLGLPPHESDAARIHTAVMQRMALVRRYQLGEHAETVAALLNELSAAFNCLSDPQRRREYDDQLRAAADSRTTPVAAAAAQSGSLPSISTEPATVRERHCAQECRCAGGGRPGRYHAQTRGSQSGRMFSSLDRTGQGPADYLAVALQLAIHQSRTGAGHFTGHVSRLFGTSPTLQAGRPGL